MFRSLVFIASIIAGAHAFSGGAPDTVCKSMTPDHPAKPQTELSPYSISLNKEAIHPGDEVKVTLQGASGEQFKGFIIEARVGEAIVGKFQVDPNDAQVQTINCLGGEKNAVTHRNSDNKSKITVTWVAPKGFEQGVVFKATIVKSALVFWLDLTSSTLAVRH